MYQSLRDVLAVQFTCASSIEVGDVVVISGNKTVAINSAAGALTVVGTVCKHRDDELVCTVETRFRERRDDRASGASVAVGPFVFDASNKVIAYDSNSHDPAAIRGLVITAANAGDVVVETLEY
jgi:hypothetical protein